jgi:hypothetical protein
MKKTKTIIDLAGSVKSTVTGVSIEDMNPWREDTLDPSRALDVLPDTADRIPGLYETDFYLWTQQQAALLRAGKLSALDVLNLAEEVDAMGRSEKRHVREQLEQLTSHLLLLKVSRWRDEHRRRAWTDEVIRSRIDVARDLAEGPSLQEVVHDLFVQAWPCARAAVNKILRDQGDGMRVPIACPFSLEDVLADDFWPQYDLHARSEDDGC